MMTDEELCEQVQGALGTADILTPRERAVEAMSLIGRHVSAEYTGLMSAVIRGTTSPTYPPPGRHRGTYRSVRFLETLFGRVLRRP
jgi:hypothetical protein